MPSGIYQIANVLTGKCYIGRSLRIVSRWSGHLTQLRRGDHSNPHLQALYNKYGPEVFVFSILEEVAGERLIEREQHYLDTLKPEYNVARTVGSSRSIPRETHKADKPRKRTGTVALDHKAESVTSPSMRKHRREMLKGALATTQQPEGLTQVLYKHLSESLRHEVLSFQSIYPPDDTHESKPSTDKPSTERRAVMIQTQESELRHMGLTRAEARKVAQRTANDTDQACVISLESPGCYGLVAEGVATTADYGATVECKWPK